MEGYARLCDADVHQGQAHTCDDPVSCGIASIGQGEPEADWLHELLDRVEELCEGSKAKVAGVVLTTIHQARGGPR